MSDPVPAAPGPASVSDMLEAAWRRFKASALKCLPLMMPAVLAAQAADIYWITTGRPMTRLIDPRDGTYYLLTIAGLMLYLWLAAAVVLRLHALGTGRLEHWSVDLRTAAGRWPALFTTWMLATLLVMVGLLALLLPGLFLIVCLPMLLPVVLLEGLPPVAAIRRCIVLVRPIWVKVLAALVIGIVVALVCLFTAGVVMALLLTPLGEGNTAAVSAISTTLALLIAALTQLFFYALALEIHSSASASV